VSGKARPDASDAAFDPLGGLSYTAMRIGGAG